MGQKDILEKVLLSHGDVFADCENALAYGGEQRLRAEELIPAPTESFYPGAEGLCNQFSDVSSFWVMNHLSEEVRRRFTSDMGFVVDYLNEGGFESRRGQKIIHVEALCQMMAELTGDTRFTDLAAELLEKQKEGKDIIMCEYIDMLEARGEERGIRIGEARGEERGIQIGEARGEVTGETRLAELIRLLLREKKYKEIEIVSGSRERRHELYREYGI